MFLEAASMARTLAMRSCGRRQTEGLLGAAGPRGARGRRGYDSRGPGPRRAAGCQDTRGPRELRWPQKREMETRAPRAETPREADIPMADTLTCVILLCTEDTMAEEMCPSFS